MHPHAVAAAAVHAVTATMRWDTNCLTYDSLVCYQPKGAWKPERKQCQLLAQHVTNAALRWPSGRHCRNAYSSTTW